MKGWKVGTRSFVAGHGESHEVAYLITADRDFKNPPAFVVDSDDYAKLELKAETQAQDATNQLQRALNRIEELEAALKLFDGTDIQGNYYLLNPRGDKVKYYIVKGEKIHRALGIIK